MALRKPLEADFEHFRALFPKWLSGGLCRLSLSISGPCFPLSGALLLASSCWLPLACFLLLASTCLLPLACFLLIASSCLLPSYFLPLARVLLVVSACLLTLAYFPWLASFLLPSHCLFPPVYSHCLFLIDSLLSRFAVQDYFRVLRVAWIKLSCVSVCVAT